MAAESSAPLAPLFGCAYCNRKDAHRTDAELQACADAFWQRHQDAIDAGFGDSDERLGTLRKEQA